MADGETILRIVERIDTGVVPTANPCPSRENWNLIRDWIREQIAREALTTESD